MVDKPFLVKHIIKPKADLRKSNLYVHNLSEREHRDPTPKILGKHSPFFLAQYFTPLAHGTMAMEKTHPLSEAVTATGCL